MPFPKFSDAKNALAARLADQNFVFWTNVEVGIYLIEALRTWNALTEIWTSNFAFNTTPAGIWYDLTQIQGSPRLRTLQDTDLYTVMQYHLLEPPSGGGTWSGTSQFSLSDLQNALQRRRDEMIQRTACYLAIYSIPSTPNVQRFPYPFSGLEPVRQRFIPDSGAGAGNPVTLTREDTMTFDGFSYQHNQTPSLPTSFSVITEPPQSFDLDVGPNVAGSHEVIEVRQGFVFSPPSLTPLGIPNDWAWVAKWGALADLLSRDSEATDRPRANYCFQRFEDGIKIMQHANWIEGATIANVPVELVSVREKDAFDSEWSENPNAWQACVVGGMDLVAACPVGNQALSVNLIGNAPVPVFDTDDFQVLQDTYDAILDYAQVLASFKMGGAEFADTKGLEAKFYSFAVQNNKRLAQLGLFSDLIHLQGKKQQISQPRGYTT